MDKLGKQLVVRVDGELFDFLKKDAEENGRTVAQTVRFLLKKHINQQEKKTP